MSRWKDAPNDAQAIYENIRSHKQRTIPELMLTFSISRAKAYTILAYLKEQGLIRKAGRGIYRVK